MLNFAGKIIKIPDTGYVFNFLLVLSVIFLIQYASPLKAIAQPVNSASRSIMVMNDKEYADTYGKIRTNPQEYKGKLISVKGFVYKNSAFDKNNFFLARMYMYCCAADIQIVGFICKLDKLDKLKNGQWLKITGIINYKSSYYPTAKGTIINPYLKVITIENIKPLKDQYVY